MEVTQGVFNGGRRLLAPFISGQCADKSDSPSANTHLKAVLLRMQQGQKSLSAPYLPPEVCVSSIRNQRRFSWRFCVCLNWLCRSVASSCLSAFFRMVAVKFPVFWSAE